MVLLQLILNPIINNHLNLVGLGFWLVIGGLIVTVLLERKGKINHE